MADAQRPILLTGVTGQVGGELLPLLQRLGPVVAPSRADLDLGDRKAVVELIQSLQPRWIVNPAAYTAVDAAETDAARAYAVNRDAVEALGEAAAHLDIPVLHISTDYVFSGEGVEPWKESDPTGPLGVYGASKLAGEQALAATGAPYLIFRTSWIYGVNGRNFLKSILRFAAEREEMRIVADQYGAPTWSFHLAEAILGVVQHCEAKAEGGELGAYVRSKAGVYHAAAAGETSWFGFAEAFLQAARRLKPRQTYARLVPIATAEYPTPARRPSNSRLNCDKLDDAFGQRLPPWQQGAEAVTAEVLSA